MLRAFFVLLLALPARAELIHAPAAGEVSGFSAEWCAPARPSTVVKQLCFGSATFQGENVRAFTFMTSAGARELFVETSFRGVDLLTPHFQIVGPLGESLGSAASEIADATLIFDARGEAVSAAIHSPSLGDFSGMRR